MLRGAPSNLPVVDTLSVRQNVSGTGYFSACVALPNPRGEPVYTGGLQPLPRPADPVQRAGRVDVPCHWDTGLERVLQHRAGRSRPA
jgi:hypothetical protein